MYSFFPCHICRDGLLPVIRIKGMSGIRQYKVGIIDADERYVQRLMQYINRDIKNPILALGFLTMETLEAYLKEHELDLLLAAGDMEVCSGENCREVLYFRTERPEAGLETGSIYKFSRADVILDKIVSRLKIEPRHAGTELYCTYGVISPVGRSGKTRLAMALCAFDEVRGGLYLGMEEYGEIPDTDQRERDVMSNLFYLVKNRSEELIPYLEREMRQLDGFYMLPSPASYQDLRSITKADMIWMMDELVKWGRFTTIVCDIGGAALGDLSVLEVFDYLLMPVLEDEYSMKKTDAFIRLLERRELGKLAGRIRKVRLPDAGYQEPAMLGYLERKLEGIHSYENRG